MTTLHVEIAGRSLAFDEPRVVSIGRDPGSDIALTGPTVSRRHAQIRSDGSGWVLVDTGSSSGTWLNGARVTEVRISGRTAVRFGSVDGEELVLTPAGAENRPAAQANVAGIPPGLAQTILPGTGPVGPGYVSGPGVLVRTAAGPKRFPPGSIVRIGRDPGLEVVVDDPSVSRLHGVIEGRPDGWWYVDRSTAGTYLEEDRVVQRRLGEPTMLMLGHPTAGAEVEVVPIVEAGQAQRSIAKKKRKRTAALVGGIAAALVLVGGGVTAAVVLGEDEEASAEDPPALADGLSTEELDRAKLASVLIISLDDTGTPVSTGSGTIISEDGLILTNAHVGKPSAPGQVPPGEDPATLQIALTTDKDDSPAAPSYTAEPIVADGVLDLAVLKITADADGNPVEGDLDLPEPLALGDSDDLRTGDEITALGFPAVAHVASDDGLDRALTVTRGVVSTFLKEAAVPSSRAWIDSDIRIGSGNSGGASINGDGELVGVNTAVVTEATVEGSGEGGAFTGGSARIRPANLAAELVEIARKGGDPEYVSPYLEEMPDPPADPMGDASAASGGWSVDGQSDCATPSTLEDPQTLTGVTLPGTLYAHYAVTGLPDGTPFTIELRNPEGEPLGSLDGQWTLGSDEVCAVVGLDIPEGLAGANAVLVIGETEIQNPVLFE